MNQFWGGNTIRLKYEWRAIYDDDSYLDEIKVDGTPNKYTGIGRSRLKQFQLIERKTGIPKVTIHIKPGQKLIHRRRVAMRFQLDGSPPQRETTWIVGWHENRQGVNVQQLFFVFEDGTIETLDRWREDQALYNSVVLMPDERLE